MGSHLDNTCYITALHHAAYKGHFKMVLALINAGANINAIDYNGSRLHQAAEKGYTDIVLALIEASVSINVAERFHEWTPIVLWSIEGVSGSLKRFVLPEPEKIPLQEGHMLIYKRYEKQIH